MSTEAYHDPTLPVATRVEDLLARMTVAEKVGQLHQMFILPEQQEESIPLVQRGGLGSRIIAETNQAGNNRDRAVAVDKLNAMQRVAVEESRLGIPLIHGRDIIHGHRTVFPIPLGMAATWNRDIVAAAYRVAAREAASAGIHWTFAPMLDIARDPRWGRIVEGYGEDPFLAARMAEAAVLGLQGNDLADPERVLACAKHFIGYGGAAGGRDYDTAEISDHTLRNVYLPPFRAAIAGGVGSVMSALNDMNGEAASNSKRLLTTLLREECGFTGFVVSDWGAVTDLIHHRLAENPIDAALQAFNAGVDMDMLSGAFSEHLAAHLTSGGITLEHLDDACRRVLTAKFQLGLFEQPYTDPLLAESVQFCAEHQALARQVAGQSVVLLQNRENILPLPGDVQRIAVIGPYAHERESLLGAWTQDGVGDETGTIAEAIHATWPDATLLTTQSSLTDEMLHCVIDAEMVILVVGESQARTGEYNSVASLDLPAGQEELIVAVHNMGKPVVLVVVAGRPVTLTRVVHHASAILFAWHPGSLGAAAIADILRGNIIPSGKLPISYPRATGQIPVHYNHHSAGRPSLRYMDLPTTPLYPFGFGLSYTTFAYSDIQVESSHITLDATTRVSALVTNTGRCSGEEVVQCYMQDCVASLARPVRELKGFTRIALAPAESRRVSFLLGPAELGFFDRAGCYIVEPGMFQIWIGGDSCADLGMILHVTAAD